MKSTQIEEVQILNCWVHRVLMTNGQYSSNDIYTDYKKTINFVSKLKRVKCFMAVYQLETRNTFPVLKGSL